MPPTEHACAALLIRASGRQLGFLAQGLRSFSSSSAVSVITGLCSCFVPMPSRMWKCCASTLAARLGLYLHGHVGYALLRAPGCRYAAPLYIDIEQTVRVKDSEGEVLEENVEKYDKIFMGEVPIMLRSSYCSLADRSNRELTTLGECPYDQASNSLSCLPTARGRRQLLAGNHWTHLLETFSRSGKHVSPSHGESSSGTNLQASRRAVTSS